MENKHKETIYELVQNTLDMCGNTLQAVKEYCEDNNLDSREFEEIRFRAMQDFYNDKDLY